MRPSQSDIQLAKTKFNIKIKLFCKCNVYMTSNLFILGMTCDLKKKKLFINPTLHVYYGMPYCLASREAPRCLDRIWSSGPFDPEADALPVDLPSQRWGIQDTKNTDGMACLTECTFFFLFCYRARQWKYNQTLSSHFPSIWRQEETDTDTQIYTLWAKVTKNHCFLCMVTHLTALRFDDVGVRREG
jgi:hypothetical protein